MADFSHRSVLLPEVLDGLQPRPGGRYLDGTLGGAGHAHGILERSAPDGLLVGIDRDPAALAAATARLASFTDRAILRHGAFADMADLAGSYGPFNGILLDLGVSSPQLDQPDRGFSFRADGPLDMRMDPTRGPTAAELLDELDEHELIRILRVYGEEPRARRIAQAVLAGRPWPGTLALAEEVARSSGYRNSRTHPATRTFQALRIAVNRELEQLELGLAAALLLLAPGGRMAVISFHSLEDRLVKHTFRDWAGKNTPRDPYGHPIRPPDGRIAGRAKAGKEHDAENPRARSARLRVFERTPGGSHAPS